MQDKIHEVLQRSPLNHQNTWSPLSMPALRPWSLRCFGSFSTRKSPTLEHLRHPAARGEVFLVGTSHISAASAAEAKHCKHKTQGKFLCCFLIHSLEKSIKVSQDALLGTQKTARQEARQLPTHIDAYILWERDRIIYWYIVYTYISICTCDMYLHYIYIPGELPRTNLEFQGFRRLFPFFTKDHSCQSWTTNTSINQLREYIISSASLESCFPIVQCYALRSVKWFWMSSRSMSWWSCAPDRRQRLQAERLDESCSILPGAFGGTSGKKSRKAWFMFSFKHAQIENEEGEIIWL